MSGSNASDLIGRSPGGRKLIAVVYADMVGYSRLIGLDDTGTLQRLRALRSNVIDPAIREHGGRLVQTGGDSLLIVFDSIDGAVRCSVKVQQRVPEHDGDQTPDRAIRFRVGINIGDAIADGTDLHGDAVNVAARIQAECPPGGIYITRAVRDHVHGRLGLEFEELGALTLKNIARPIEAFVVRFGTADSALNLVERSLAQSKPAYLPLPDKPSIAVLPFQNMSADPEQDYFADGMVEDIITAISRVRWLFVIARNSSFAYKGKSFDIRQIGRELGVRYVLEGSVRKVGNRVRITGQLIDTLSGSHIWSDRFDCDMADIFDLQDQVTASVVAAIEPKLINAEIERAKRKPAANLQAYDLFLRALASIHTLDLDGIDPAIALLDKAIAFDPSYARAFALKTRLQVRRIFTIGADSSAPMMADTVRLARLAAEKDRDDPDVLWMASFAVTMAGGDLQGGIALIDRSLALNPNCAEALAHGAIIYAFSGNRSMTIAYADRALRLNPMGRAIYNVYWARGVLDFVGANYEGCREWMTQTLREMPMFPPALRYQAASLSQLGRHDEARNVVCRLLTVTPDATIARVRLNLTFYAAPEAAGIRDAMLDGLRQAGLPEGNLL